MINSYDYDYLATNILYTHLSLGQVIEFCEVKEIRDNVYHEVKNKRYEKGIKLHALIKYRPTAEHLTPTGLDKKANLLVTLSSIELIDNKILELQERDILKRRFKVGSEYYTIISFRPVNNVLGKPIQYKFECVGVDYYAE